MTASQKEVTSSQCHSLLQRHSGRRESRDDLQPPFTITCLFRTFFIVTLVESDSVKLGFLYGMMCAMDRCYLWLPYCRHIVYSSCESSLHSYFAIARLHSISYSHSYKA
ncbi:hypothetical protein SFRURICE_011204 [Spodoptera frugiperda]|nr:hypothetical protein SFRURICE_011204 [Spodoptera frugiperda]